MCYERILNCITFLLDNAAPGLKKQSSLTTAELGSQCPESLLDQQQWTGGGFHRDTALSEPCLYIVLFCDSPEDTKRDPLSLRQEALFLGKKLPLYKLWSRVTDFMKLMSPGDWGGGNHCAYLSVLTCHSGVTEGRARGDNCRRT